MNRFKQPSGPDTVRRHDNLTGPARLPAGQALVEYVILLALVSVAVVAVLATLGSGIASVFGPVVNGSGQESGDNDGVLTVRVSDATENGISGIRIFAYSGQGTYLNRYVETGSDGDGQFALARGSYQFLVRHQMQWFWSDTVTLPEDSFTQIDTGLQTFFVTVASTSGHGVEGVPVHVYTEDDEFTGLSGITDASGSVDFALVDGMMKFRVDHGSNVIWSEPIDTDTGSTTIIVTSCSDGQFQAEYFNNRTLSGDPVLTRCENEISHNWGSGGPGSGVPNNNFSVRWTGRVSFDDATYAFSTTTDDGVRLWVDNALIIDSWRNQSATTFRARRWLTQGGHNIRMEYFERGGNATARLDWETAVTDCRSGQFLADYYRNRSLSGQPSVSRCESTISYGWGSGPPVSGIGRNNFSVRWEGEFDFSEGTYTFAATTDDGVRLWVDDALVIDAWSSQSGATNRARVSLTDGAHRVRMDYYERGGSAAAVLEWTPAVVDCPKGQFLAEYFNNVMLSGEPAVSRCETNIDYSWGGGAPVPGINTNNFSVRWTGTFDFAARDYEFVVVSDDGIQMWLDNDVVISAWRNQPATEYRQSRMVDAGEHSVRIHYYERGGNAVARASWH